MRFSAFPVAIRFDFRLFGFCSPVPEREGGQGEGFDFAQLAKQARALRIPLRVILLNRPPGYNAQIPQEALPILRRLLWKFGFPLGISALPGADAPPLRNTGEGFGNAIFEGIRDILNWLSPYAYESYWQCAKSNPSPCPHSLLGMGKQNFNSVFVSVSLPLGENLTQ